MRKDCLEFEIVAVHGDILDAWKKNRLRGVVGRTYPPRATDARDARFETCCSTLAGLPVEGVFRAGGNKEPHMQPSGQVGKFKRTGSSVGQSGGLITRWSLVQVQAGPLLPNGRPLNHG